VSLARSRNSLCLATGSEWSHLSGLVDRRDEGHIAWSHGVLCSLAPNFAAPTPQARPRARRQWCHIRGITC
jgi:hypothetical protein